MKYCFKQRGKYIATVILVFAMYVAVGQQVDCPLPEVSNVQRAENAAAEFRDQGGTPGGELLPGIIRVKIRREMLPPDGFRLMRDMNHCIVTGITEIDSLNRKFRIHKMESTFRISLRNERFRERHHSWGFHQWFDLYSEDLRDIHGCLSAYNALVSVETAEPLYKVYVEDSPGQMTKFTPDDSLFYLQWNFHNTGQSGGTPGCDINLPEALDITCGDTSIIVAVMDNGVDLVHHDLAPNVWPGRGYNFVSGNPDPEPCLHGTEVAGLIAAKTNNHRGIAGVAGGNGQANGVKMMSCQIFSCYKETMEDYAPDAFVWSADHGAAISSNSWGGTEISQATLTAIDYFIANGGGSVLRGGLVVCAAHNQNTDIPRYPAAYSPCIAVAATNDMDRKASYSNYGDWIDISAPGGDVSLGWERGIILTAPGNSYEYGNGTSMGTPQVSGVAALIISLAKGRFTPDDVRDILFQSTDDIDSLNQGYQGKLGCGRLDAASALILAQKVLDPLNPTAPLNISAQAVSDDRIILNWISCPETDSVMIAFSTDRFFGTPATVLQTGSTIPGGGTVTYMGTDRWFSHDGLDPDKICHYRIWSVKNNRCSPITRSAQCTPGCGVVSFFPLGESFELHDSRPHCWTEDPGIPPWQFLAGDSAPDSWYAHSGNKFAFLESPGETGEANNLILPPFHPGGFESMKLKFWHRQQAGSGNHCTLRVFCRTESDTSWKMMKSFSMDIPEWKQDSVFLPKQPGSCYLRFEGIPGPGGRIALDDILIIQAKPIELTVTPSSLRVPAREGGTAFYVVSNVDWNSVSYSEWCHVRFSDDGHDSLFVEYEANTSVLERMAEIGILAGDSPEAQVTITQEASPPVGGGVQVSPNPARGEVVFSFAVGQEQTVTLEIFNSPGIRVYREEVFLTPGIRHIRWHPKNLPSAPYLFRIGTKQETFTGKFVLIR